MILTLLVPPCNKVVYKDVWCLDFYFFFECIYFYRGVSLQLLLFWNFLLHALDFNGNEDGVYLHTQSDGRLYNLAILGAKTKVRRVTIREALFSDDAALASHTE
jgi:hypothetical protein